VSKRRRQLPCLLRALVVVATLYSACLVVPAFLGGSVLDKSKDSFRGSMTLVGAGTMKWRAWQTVHWTISAMDRVPLSMCEIGPSRGVLAHENYAMTYYAVDLDPACLANVVKQRQGTRSATCYLCRVPPLPPEMPNVDVVVAENVLEHMADYGEAKAFLAGCFDKLLPGGCIVLRFPEIRESGWRFWEEAPDHAYVTTGRRVMNLLGEVGFRVQRQGLALDCFDGWKGWIIATGLRCFPWQTMHDLCYAPYLSSPWSRLAAKTRHCYVVAVKSEGEPPR